MKLIKTTELPNHRLYEFLGIKLKIKRSRLEKEVMLLRRLIEESIDITKIPPAKGNLRKVQLINLKLLELVDIFLKKHNVQYWLEYGTLIGAIRHKGFIPWDDDIDLGVMSDDYYKLPELLKDDLAAAGLTLSYHQGPSSLLRIFYKDFGIDFFPYEYLDKRYETDEEKQVVYDRWYKVREEMLKKHSLDKIKTGEITSFELRDSVQEIKNKLWGYKYISNPDSKQIIRCVESMVATTNKAELGVFETASIFPLKTCEFDGLSMSIPCDPLQHLYEAREYGEYGAIMNFPRLSHSGFAHTQTTYENSDYDYDADLKELEKLVERFKTNK